MPTLDIFKSDGYHRRIEVGPDGVRIGRALGNDLVLEDTGKGVSRSHAEVRLERGQYYILDLNSQNGVWMDERRVTKEPLVDGAALTIGPYRLVFDLHGNSSGNIVAEVLPQSRESVPALANVGTPTPVASGADASTHKRPAVRGKSSFPFGLPPVVIVLGGSAVGILAVVLIVTLAGGNPPREPVPVTRPPVEVLDNRPEPAQVSTPDAPPLDPIITHLDAARRLIEQGDLVQARQELNAVVRLDAGNADAKKLIAQLERSRTPAQNQRPPVTPTSREWPAGLPVVAQRADESPIGRETRARAVFENYSQARSNLDSGNLSAAIQQFQGILDQEPGYLDAAQQLAEARRRTAAQRRDQAVRRLEQGRGLQTRGDLVGASREYNAAIEIDGATPGARDALNAVTQLMLGEGEQAFKDAKVAEAYRKLEDARRFYQKAIDYLPSTDARAQEARQRLASLPRVP